MGDSLLEAMKWKNLQNKNPQTKEAMNFLTGFVPGASDVQSGLMAAQDIKNQKYAQALLDSVGMLPMIPAMGGITKNLSKYITNESGVPLTLYHGGPKFEGKFKVPKSEDKGIYFTDNPYLAQDQFALQHELAMRDKTGYGYKDVPEHMLDSGEWDPKYFKFAEVKKVNLKANNPKIVESLDAKLIPHLYSPEHDAVIVKNAGDFGYNHGQYVVFDPNQIEYIK